MNIKNLKIAGAALFFTAAFNPVLAAQAELSNESILFIKGNIQEKIQAVKAAAERGDYSLCVKGIDFAIETSSFLSTDGDILDLLKECITDIKKTPALSDSEISSRLCTVFKTFSDTGIKLEVLSRFKDFPSSSAVSIVNSFVSEGIQKSAPADDAIINSIRFLKENGNTTSFRLIFVADMINVWPQEKELLAECWGPLANNAENEILQLFTGASTEDKLIILNSVRKNPHISNKIRGEVAENAFSQAIYTSDDTSRSLIDLQLSSLEAVAETQWTRAAGLAASYFSVARKHYESGLITAQEFDSVISSITKVASTRTGETLAQYLDFLNRNMEMKNTPDKVVVLSVINALGGLGDKTAFDSLLYVTYLAYPEDVISAARNALAKLKW